MLLLLHGDPTPAITILGYDFPRLHAMLNDFPAALLVTAVLFEVAGLVTTRESFRLVGFWTLLAGVLGGVAAVLTGLAAEDRIEHGEGIHRIMEEHEMLALWTLGIFAVLAVWRVIRERRMARGERIAALVLGLVGTAILVDTGRQGGKLVFEHAAGTPMLELRREIKDREAGHSHEEGEGAHDHDDDHGSSATHSHEHQ
jgi:uncharacterized membrane protein